MGDRTASDMDGGWKQVIDDFLEDFFLFFFPAIHSLIDFGEECQLLDKELAALVAGSATGRRHVDKLISVHWKDGRRRSAAGACRGASARGFRFRGSDVRL